MDKCQGKLDNVLSCIDHLHSDVENARYAHMYSSTSQGLVSDNTMLQDLKAEYIKCITDSQKKQS